MLKYITWPSKTKQALEPDWDMGQILERSDREFKIIMINILKVLMQKVGKVYKQMDSESGDVDSKQGLREFAKNQKYFTEMQDYFDEHINSLNMAKESTNELENK